MAHTVKCSKTDEDAIRARLSYDANSGVLRWNFHRGGKAVAGAIAGYINARGYRVLMLNDKNFAAHRVAWFLTYGKWPRAHIDHINGNCADNRLCNLREATNAENLRNRGKPKNNTSGFKGVWFCKRLDRWMAELRVGGEKKYLGIYKSPEEAAVAYAKGAAKFFGEFAKT